MSIQMTRVRYPNSVQIIPMPEDCFRVWDGLLQIGDQYLVILSSLPGVWVWRTLTFKDLIEDFNRNRFEHVIGCIAVARRRTTQADLGEPCTKCNAAPYVQVRETDRYCSWCIMEEINPKA